MKDWCRENPFLAFMVALAGMSCVAHVIEAFSKAC